VPAKEARVITIGIDAHKQIHAGVALDDAGQEIAEWRGPNSPAGWEQLRAWAAQLGDERQWGIEGAWNYGRGLAQYLVAASEAVFEINARWTAIGRRSGRRPGKTDQLDARAVALLVRRESASLPSVHADDQTVVLELLATEREGALAEATRLRNQIHALLLQLDPEYRDHLPTVNSQAGVRALLVYQALCAGPVQQERAATVRRLASRLQLTLTQADVVARRLKEEAQRRFVPLTQLCGVNLLTAGTLAGILGPGRRFANEAQLAAYAGVAPLEASSAGYVRHRLNRGGNRRLNAILYRIALTQAHFSPEARAYLDRRVTQGKSRREAIRALKRHLVRAVWRLWLQCDLSQTGSTATCAAA
jgi:transposase